MARLCTRTPPCLESPVPPKTLCEGGWWEAPPPVEQPTFMRETATLLPSRSAHAPSGAAAFAASTAARPAALAAALAPLDVAWPTGPELRS